mmetsp:Transcript_19003/g.60954  ORF Transcript_19003/g.60954 Transcript_19003/m.60954 type:complete len:297 (+) Transcript_19003:42-932(+)
MCHDSCVPWTAVLVCDLCTNHSLALSTLCAVYRSARDTPHPSSSPPPSALIPLSTPINCSSNRRYLPARRRLPRLALRHEVFQDVLLARVRCRDRLRAVHLVPLHGRHVELEGRLGASRSLLLLLLLLAAAVAVAVRLSLRAVARAQLLRLLLTLLRIPRRPHLVAREGQVGGVEGGVRDRRDRSEPETAQRCRRALEAGLVRARGGAGGGVRLPAHRAERRAHRRRHLGRLVGDGHAQAHAPSRQRGEHKVVVEQLGVRVPLGCEREDIANLRPERLRPVVGRLRARSEGTLGGD